MPRKDEEDEEDDDFQGPFDIFKFFSDPNKFLKSKQFKKMFKEIFEKIFNTLPPDFQDFSPEEIRKYLMENKDKFPFKSPIMYGFNFGIGPDGMPTINSFGNIKKEPYSGKAEVNRAREPLVEVNEENDQIIVIAEVPGVTKEDVEIKATSHSLTISTKPNSVAHAYYKEIELPSPINSDYAKASLRNGILMVKLKKINIEKE
ncbi:MAG: Hsp20/alpha crystallin family protein [Candidatus Hermodarchaeota archaeon]